MLRSSDTGASHWLRADRRPGPLAGAWDQRISSTGSTPNTGRPERIATAVAATSASLARVATGRGGEGIEA